MRCKLQTWDVVLSTRSWLHQWAEGVTNGRRTLMTPQLALGSTAASDSASVSAVASSSLPDARSARICCCRLSFHSCSCSRTSSSSSCASGSKEMSCVLVGHVRWPHFMSHYVCGSDFQSPHHPGIVPPLGDQCCVTMTDARANAVLLLLLLLLLLLQTATICQNEAE